MGIVTNESVSGYKRLSIVIQGDRWSEVVEAIQKYLDRYPYIGYQTSFSEPVRKDDKVVVFGSRYTSCD